MMSDIKKSIDPIKDFQSAYKDFIKALNYINENKKILQLDKRKWEIVQSNFKNKFEKKLDEAFNSLPEHAEKRFYTKYFMHRFKDKKEAKLVRRNARYFRGRILGLN